MARLVIGGTAGPVQAGGGEGQLIIELGNLRTMEYTVEPMLDPTGKDFECARVTLEVQGIVNSIAIGTNKAFNAGGVAGRGDSLPFSMYNLRDWLMLPRQYINFSVAGQTILDSPQSLVGGGRMPCDVRGGPFPRRASYTPIIGDKSGILHYRVETYVTYSANALLSNRWTMDAHTDKHGVTSRTTHGRAVFSRDFLGQAGDVADDYRKWLIVPCPDRARRVDIAVEQNEDGSEIYYTVQDRDITFALGSASDIMEVTGAATGGVDYPIKDLKAGATALGQALGGMVKMMNIFGGLTRLLHFLRPLGAVCKRAG